MKKKAFLLSFALTILAVFAVCKILSWKRLYSPQTLADVYQASESLGLFARGDMEDGRMSRKLVLSYRPLSFEEVSRFPFAGKIDGAVAVFTSDYASTIANDAEFADLTRWGQLFLFGNQEIISKLVKWQP